MQERTSIDRVGEWMGLTISEIRCESLSARKKALIDTNQAENDPSGEKPENTDEQ